MFDSLKSTYRIWHRGNSQRYPNSTPTSAGEGHFRSGTGQATLAEIVATSHQTAGYRIVHRGEHSLRLLAIHLSAPAPRIAHSRVQSASLPARPWFHRQDRADCRAILRSIVTAICHVVNLAHGANQQRRGNCNRLLRLPRGIDVAEFVIEAVLAADERGFQHQREIVTGQRRPDQEPSVSLFSQSPQQKLSRIAMRRVGTDCHAVSHRFVDRTGGHVVGVQSP